MKNLNDAWAQHDAMFWDWKTGVMPLHKKVAHRVRRARNRIVTKIGLATLRLAWWILERPQ